jgi:hypothetical protein
VTLIGWAGRLLFAGLKNDRAGLLIVLNFSTPQF